MHTGRGRLTGLRLRLRLRREHDAARTRRGEALLLEPTERQSIEEVRVLGSQVAAKVCTNVSGGIMTFTPSGGAWRRGMIGPIDRVSMHLGASSNVANASRWARRCVYLAQQLMD